MLLASAQIGLLDCMYWSTPLSYSIIARSKCLHLIHLSSWLSKISFPNLVFELHGWFNTIYILLKSVS